ncbi:MAG: hypothetical protein WBD81_02015 [Collimonas pratensis]|uniref:hypothetical protein n=1 Tax=Collimonas pratensis TaxID=279113 RepID=UPI003C76A765
MDQESIKNYFKLTNMVMLTLSAAIGAVLYHMGLTNPELVQKESQIVLLLLLFTICYFFIETGALRRLTCRTRFSMRDNPLLKMAIGRLCAVLAMGALVYYRYVIDGLFSQIAFSVLTSMFVGGIFESYRLFRMVE